MEIIWFFKEKSSKSFKINLLFIIFLNHLIFIVCEIKLLYEFLILFIVLILTIAIRAISIQRIKVSASFIIPEIYSYSTNNINKIDLKVQNLILSLEKEFKSNQQKYSIITYKENNL